MDRFINILSVLLFSCDLLVAQKSIYKSLGSSVKLVCPIVKTTRPITWQGPSKYKVYAVGTDVSNEFSSQVEINVTDNKSILLIYRFTKDTSGQFRCSDTFNEKEFNVVIKSDPSDLAIVSATGDIITTVEGKEHNLECTVTSGQPGGNITWSTDDGKVVAQNGPSCVTYKLIPQRSDNEKLFKCAAFNSDGEKIIESSVFLKVYYIPKISFIPNQTLTVKEGKEAKLVCTNDGNDPNTTTLWKIQSTQTIISQNDTLHLKNINRTEAGLYSCIVDTRAGVYEHNAKVIVQYAPTIDIEYLSTGRKMVCIPRGVPDSYIFKDWEHTTEYNDHIRFLPITKEGNNAILTISKHETEKDDHRDRGIYICRASNNISSSDGMFVVRTYHLELNVTPHFVSSTENTQYGVYLKPAEITIKFVSVPEFYSYNVKKNGTKFQDYNKTVHKNIKLTDNVYGKNVSVKGSIISLQIQIDTLDDFNMYKIVIKNAEGSSHQTIKLVSASAPFMPKILRTEAKQTQIFVLWTPGFDGGYLQWFVVEYKEIEDINWKNQTTNSSNSTVIGGLQPATKYLIRMFARNMIDESNKTEKILILTDESVSNTEFSAIASLLAVLLCLLIIIGYFRRGKLKQFIYTRFNNQANSRAIGNDLDTLQNGIHTNSDIAEIPVYSSIDKRHNLRLHQTSAYTVDQKGITNPLKSVHKNRETGKEVNRASKFGSMKCSSGIEENEKESRELNYVEIVFDQKQVYPFTIHGVDDKTNYVEIDFTQSADPLPDSDTDSESEK